MPCITITVTEPPQPKLVWKNFRIAISGKVIDPSTPIPVGTTITVLGDLWNEGNATANATVYLTINGREVKTARVTIPPGAYIPCGWDITLTEKGSHQICLDYR
jgi:hypothetical protein